MSDTQQLLTATDSARGSPTDGATVVASTSVPTPVAKTITTGPPPAALAAAGLKRSFNRNLATLVVSKQAQLDPNVIVPATARASKASLGDGSPEDHQRRLSGRLSVDSPVGDTPVSDHRRSVDIRVAMQQAAAQEQQDEADREKAAKEVMNSPDSWIRSSIPVLPRWLSVVCLVLNIVLPGTGTMLGGASVFCCSSTRVQNGKDDANLRTFCVSLWVGIAQMFTVTFLLVGWFWSISWGVYMVSLTREAKRKRNKQLTALALNAFGGSRTSHS